MKITEYIELHNCDNRILMPKIKDNSIDLILTDPPYGMEFQSGHRKVKHEKIKDDNNLYWLPNFCSELKMIVKEDAHIYIFCSFHNIDIFKHEFQKLFNVKNILIWEKNNTGMGDLYGDYAPQYEMILFCSNGKKKLNNGRDSNIIKAKRTNNENHPTEKPINLMQYFIEKSSKVGDLVADFYSGSGSTAIACHNTKRNFIGCEIDKYFYDKSIDKIKNHTSQQKLF